LLGTPRFSYRDVDKEHEQDAGALPNLPANGPHSGPYALIDKRVGSAVRTMLTIPSETPY